jgi:hypothetical protein
MSFPKTEEIEPVILLELDAIGGRRVCQRDLPEGYPTFSSDVYRGSQSKAQIW